MFVYGITTVGATVHVHFCMDKVIGWDFSQSETNTCYKCGMKESKTKKGCCKDEVKQLKIDTDQQKSRAAVSINFFQPPVINILPAQLKFTDVVFEERVRATNYPPPLTQSIQKLTVLYCTYRI